MNSKPMGNAVRAGLGCAAALAFLHLPAAAAEPVTLPDSTVAESWELPNGLRVVTRHIPRTTGVAIVVCYRAGSDDDPPGSEGTASLIAEVAFTSAAGEMPERTREEMRGLRPLGWNLRVSPDHTQFCEIASREQFPGVLREVATRMRGVKVTESGVRAAIATVKRDLARAYSGDVDLLVHNQLHQLATGDGREAARRYASGGGLRGLAARQIQQHIQTLYVPSNAVLSLAGNLSGFDLRRLLEREFGDLPAGARVPAPARGRFTPGVWSMPQAGLSEPVAALGITAPALGDSSHPSFYLHTLVIGSMCMGRWGPPQAPLTSRFEYSLLEDPDLVRFYPPTSSDPADTNSIAIPLWIVIGQLPDGLVEPETHGRLDQAISWLLGGPMMGDLVDRMRSEPGTLYLLAGAMALREMRGGEPFWAEYRRRFAEAKDTAVEQWRSYLVSPDRCVQLRLIPKR